MRDLKVLQVKGLGYAEFKSELAEAVIEEMRPLEEQTLSRVVVLAP